MAEVTLNKRPGGAFGQDFCSARHPTDEEAFCRRHKHDDGDHSAFVFSIREPERW